MEVKFSFGEGKGECVSIRDFHPVYEEVASAVTFPRPRSEIEPGQGRAGLT